jgi:hypothetical protein
MTWPCGLPGTWLWTFPTSPGRSTWTDALAAGWAAAAAAGSHASATAAITLAPNIRPDMAIRLGFDITAPV